MNIDRENGGKNWSKSHPMLTKKKNEFIYFQSYITQKKLQLEEEKGGKGITSIIRSELDMCLVTKLRSLLE